MDGNKKAFIADVFGIKESEVPEMELEKERDRWYGAAQERQIKINGLESTCRVQGKLIAEQRNNIVDLKQQVANLEEYMLKGVAFRDELQARIAVLEGERYELKPDFIDILRLVGKGMNTYMIKYPDWWKRVDGTPIPNDLAVNITEAVCKELRRRAGEG